MNDSKEQIFEFAKLVTKALKGHLDIEDGKTPYSVGVREGLILAYSVVKSRFFCFDDIDDEDLAKVGVVSDLRDVDIKE